MSDELEKYFSQLEAKVLSISKRYKNLHEKYMETSNELKEMKAKYEAIQEKSKAIEEENKNIKFYSAVSGNPEHNRLMKNHINRLIKEVDFCIAQLQNSGL